MRLGIAIQHYDARNDVRDLVALLSERIDLILFARPGHLGGFAAPGEVRYFRRAEARRHWWWSQMFRFFGGIPRSRNNFFITEASKLALVDPVTRLKAMAALRTRMLGPRWLSATKYLERLRGCDATPVEDVDGFLFITEYSDPAFLSHVLASGKPAWTYLYSWDHACKHTIMPAGVSGYLVWNTELARDMEDLQQVPVNQCHPVGATQLAYVKTYLDTPALREPALPHRYLYFGCATGHLAFALQEVRVIRFVAEVMAKELPSHKLVVRPYPMFARMDFFEELRQLPNVAFDEEFMRNRRDRSLTHQDIYHKLRLQEHADAFIHLGTTMGFEGAYLDTPILFLDLEDFNYGRPRRDLLHLRQFIHQYHNERYMLQDGYPNVVRRTGDLAAAVRGAVRCRGDYLRYNRAISGLTPLRSLEAIADAVLQRCGMPAGGARAGGAGTARPAAVTTEAGRGLD